MVGFKSRCERSKANRSQLAALLTSTCIAMTSQSLTTPSAFAQTKSTVEFSIKPANGGGVGANTAKQEEPIRISLPMVSPPSALMKPAVPVPTMPSVGLPASQNVGKVQMRLNSEEPPKLPVSVTNSANEVVRLNVASEPSRSLPLPSLPTQPSRNQSVVPKMEGPVKFSLGDTGVKDFGVQGTNVAPPSLSRAPELVKPKRFSVSQTVVLARNSEFEDGTTDTFPSEPAVQNVALPKVREENIVKQTASESPSVAPQANENRETPLSHGMVSLTKPSKPKSTSERNFVGLASSSSPAGLEESNSDNWRTVEVEREYEIETLGTYSIDAPFEIARVETQNPECCGVFNNGRAITVVGKAEGNTKVAILSKDHQRRVVGVKVLPSGQQTATPKSNLDQVKEMIANLFPDANLTFSSLESGGIEVRGTTKSESEARKVLELVRRICLVPVDDKVKVLP